jgi:PAS domain S-box-containing protein
MRKKMGLGILYTAIGLFQFLQVFLAVTVYVEISDNIFISPGSTILFTSTLFAILLVYIKEDAAETRKLIYALIIANLVMAVLLYSINWNVYNIAKVNTSFVSLEFFNLNSWVLFMGTIILFVDSILIIVLFEFISKYVRPLFLRICITMVLVLSFDAIAFSIGSFWGSEKLMTSIYSGLISKNAAAIVLSIFYTVYLKYIEKVDFDPHFFNMYNIFKTFSYKQKYNEIGKAIEVSENRYRMLTNISPSGIFLTNINGEIIFINPSWSKISGLSQREAINNEWFTAVHPDDRILVQNEWNLAVSNKLACHSKFRFTHKNGTVNWVLCQLIPEKDSDSIVTGFVGTITDITEIKKMQTTA